MTITRTWGDKSGLAWDDPRRLVEVRACGVHLAAARRRAENDAKRAAAGAAAQAEEAERRRRRQVAADHVEQLLALGFAAVVGWDGTGRYDVLLNGEVVVALVEQYQLLCRELGLDFAAEVEALTHGGRT